MSKSSSTPNPPPFDEREARMTVEILDGFQLMSPRSGLPQAMVAGKLYSALDHCFSRKSGGPPERPGGWIVLIEPELHLGDSVIVPDIAAWRRDRLPRPDLRSAATHVAPDWACEVLSESTAKADRQRKMPIYHRHHVANVWLVEPQLRSIELFRWNQDGYILLTESMDQDPLCAEPFAAVKIPLEEIWPEFD